jgi:hypothetical protein
MKRHVDHVAHLGIGCISDIVVRGLRFERLPGRRVDLKPKFNFELSPIFPLIGHVLGVQHRRLGRFMVIKHTAILQTHPDPANEALSIKHTPCVKPPPGASSLLSPVVVKDTCKAHEERAAIKGRSSSPSTHCIVEGF